jgi:site-specific DNA-methyltransferase (adenine-specific)
MISYQDENLTVLIGDCREQMKSLQDETVHTIVTSPPYWGLRDYGHAEQLGAEENLQDYVNAMVDVFREAKRLLRSDGTLWLNLGDSYNSDKQLLGMPWRVALALQADGWYLRSEIIWHKPNAMPENVTDRPSKSHEHIFLLAKNKKYYYDHESIKEPALWDGTDVKLRFGGAKYGENEGEKNRTKSGKIWVPAEMKNKRDVWSVATRAYAGSHCAVFPPELIEPCVLAGAPSGGVVLDPFGGSGTTAEVSNRLGRKAILIELNPEYITQIRRRTAQSPLGI